MVISKRGGHTGKEERNGEGREGGRRGERMQHA
jgi:hypothetical protein